MPQMPPKSGQKGRKRKILPKIASDRNLYNKINVDDDDEESIISGDEGLDEDRVESDNETAQAKRLRLAKQYIEQLEKEEQEKQLDEEISKDAIAHRLQQDILEDAGRLQKFIADQIVTTESEIKFMHGHQLSVTCVIISNDDKFIFSASKDGSIIKWDACTCKKKGKISGVSKSKSASSDKKAHVGQVLTLAISTDFQFLASAGHDKLIHVWNPDTLDWLHTFKGHRDIITGLAFQQKQHQLFSASHDKSVKVWSLNEMAYVETLFGHEDAVLGVESLSRNHAVSCGGRDRSVRMWKIAEESQLVFQSSTGSSFDCIAMLNEDYFLTGGDDGSLSIFFVRKKKPVTFRTNAHVKSESSPTGCCDESWITSVTSLPYTDLVASGSCDGCIRLWRCEKSFKSIMPVQQIKINGFVNSLRFSHKGDFLVAGIGQEHRLGRWWSMKNVKNSICIIPLNRKNVEDT